MISPIEFALWWGVGVAVVLWGFSVARARSRRRWRELERAQVREEAAKARLAMRQRSLEDELRRERKRTNYLVGEVAGAREAIR